MSKSHLLPIFDCEYGCGQPARYEFKSGILCCSDNASKCLTFRKIISNSRLDNNYKHADLKVDKKQKQVKFKETTKKIIPNHDSHLLPIFDCEFGCGQPARYRFKNGKFYCNEITVKCPVLRKINSEKNSGENNPFYNKHHTPENLLIIGEKSKGRQAFLHKHHTKETCELLSKKRLGTHNSPESNEKNRISNTGKTMPPRTDDWRKNQSEYMLNGGSEKANLKRHGYIISDDDLPDFQLYYKIVWRFTAISAGEKFTLEELKQRGNKKENGDKHIDHIFSIAEGFRQGILPQIIGSKANLRLVPCDYNLSKNDRCDITLEELYKLYDEIIK